MIESSCLFCEQKPFTRLFSQTGHDPYLELLSKELNPSIFDWNICFNCGSVFRSPILDKDENAQLYEKYDQAILKDIVGEDYFRNIINLPDNFSENRMKVKWLKSITDKHLSLESEERSTILDAGCGGGTLIHELEKIYKRHRYYGIELNKNYADLARRMTSAEIINAPYVAGTYDFKFDIIISAKVLEHVNEPMFFLKQISNDLKYTGLTFIEVPDIQDIWTLPTNHERFWIPHLWYFSASSLNALAGLVGLTPIASRSIVTDRGRSYLQSVFRKVSHPIIIEKPFDDPKKIIEKVNAKQIARNH